jgi:hypothetical protein
MDASPATLHVRYLDWCSGQIARRLAELSASEVWERVQRVRSGDPGSSSPGVGSAFDQAEALTFDILGELGLPDFDHWLEQYRADPGPFDREILGFAVPDTSKQWSAQT